MSNSTVKIKIGNRVYPLAVSGAEVDKAKNAAALVNQKIEKLRDDYAINDWIDLLAMTAFELANKSISESKETIFIEKDNSDALRALESLSLSIDELLNSKQSFLS